MSEEITKRILILGGSSYVGRHLFARLGPERALATYNKTPIDHGIYFNIGEMSLADIVGRGDFSYGVILLGVTSPDGFLCDAPAPPGSRIRGRD